MEVGGDTQFLIGLVRPGVARATCRTGKYLDYVAYADDDVTALVRAFAYAESAVSNSIEATREKAFAALAQW